VKPDDLEKEALAAAAEARSLTALSEVRVRYLGRQSVLKLALREVRDRETGMTLNAVRETVESALAARERELARAELEERLATERVDVTLPAQLLGPPKLRPRGTLHPSTLVRRDVEDIFLGLGYEIVDGREVETTRYNFDALGFPDWHPTRSPRASLFLDDARAPRVVQGCDRVVLAHRSNSARIQSPPWTPRRTRARRRARSARRRRSESSTTPGSSTSAGARS
jgi:phenylalanyl-tRNA synthetase alpha chain